MGADRQRPDPVTDVTSRRDRDVSTSTLGADTVEYTLELGPSGVTL